MTVEAALGVSAGRGYDIASRAAPLAAAGDEAVIAAFVSIHPLFIRFSLAQCREHTTFEEADHIRNEAVGVGLRAHVPEIVETLGAMAPALWDTVDTLPLGMTLTAVPCDLVEPVGERLVALIDATAGPNWMPAARERRG